MNDRQPMALPAHLQVRPAGERRVAEALSRTLGAGSPPYVSIAGGRFAAIDANGVEESVGGFDQQLGVFLDCCIIDVGEHASKIYYKEAFNPNSDAWKPPPCWSDNGVAPSINASEPQAISCTPDQTGQHGCRWAVWGSKTSFSGKGVPACGTYQKCALLLPNHDFPFLLRVPPNSLTNLRAYVNQFAGQQADIKDVITRIWFQQGVLGTLQFKATDWLPAGVLTDLRNKILEGHATDALVGRTDVPRQGALPAPAGPPAQQLPSPIPNSAPAGFSPSPPPNSGGFGQSQPGAAPSAGSQSTGTAQQPPIGQPAPGASPSDPPKQRRRRSNAQQPPAGTSAAPPAGQPAPQAPFMSGAAPPPAPQPNGGTPGGNTGIQSGVAPNPEIAAALGGLFGNPK